MPISSLNAAMASLLRSPAAFRWRDSARSISSCMFPLKARRQSTNRTASVRAAGFVWVEKTWFRHLLEWRPTSAAS